MSSTLRWVCSAASLLAVLSACSDDPAALAVDVPTGASASPQYFHGNCFAGWSVAVELRARETNGVEVFLDSLSYRFTDQGASVELPGESLDREALESRYGAGASVLPRGGSRVFRVSAVSSDRPQGPLRVTGGLSGRDDNGNPVSTSFDVVAPLSVNDIPKPSGGACSLPSATEFSIDAPPAP